MYVAVKGGERAIANAHRLARRGAPRRPGGAGAHARRRSTSSSALAVDRVMSEGSLLRPRARRARRSSRRAAICSRRSSCCAPTARRCRGSASTRPIDTGAMTLRRRISATFKDVPGGQILGPTFDYTHRLLDFDAGAPSATAADARPRPDGRRRPPPATLPLDARLPRVIDLLDHEGLIEPEEPDADDRAGGRSHARAARAFPPSATCGCRAWRAATRASCWRSATRRSAATAATIPFAGEIRLGEVAVELVPEELGFADRDRRDHGDRVPDGEPVQGLGDGAAAVHARLRPRVRPRRAQGDGDGAGRPRAARRRARRDADRRPRRTRSSCSTTATTWRPRASCST